LNNIVTGNAPISEDSFNTPAHSLHYLLLFSYPFILLWNSHRRRSSAIVCCCTPAAKGLGM